MSCERVFPSHTCGTQTYTQVSTQYSNFLNNLEKLYVHWCFVCMCVCVRGVRSWSYRRLWAAAKHLNIQEVKEILKNLFKKMKFMGWRESSVIKVCALWAKNMRSSPKTNVKNLKLGMWCMPLIQCWCLGLVRQLALPTWRVLTFREPFFCPHLFLLSLSLIIWWLISNSV